MNRKKSGACAMLWLLVPGLACPAAAEEEDLYFSSLPVVATVSRLPQALADAPGSVTVIDQDMIRASGARHVSDLLRLVPGFQVTPPTTDAPHVSYHGLGNEEFSPRVQVLIDGRSQYSPLFQGGVNWNILPVALEDIARIEVVRGSNSAAYGSNAFMGVVNIVTLDASQARGTVLATSYGNQGVQDHFFRWGGRVGMADLRLTARRQADSGQSFQPVNRGDPSNVLDGSRLRHIDFRADVSLSDRDQLQLGFGALENRLDTGSAGVNKEFEPPREKIEGNSFFHADWRRALGTDEEVGLRYFHAEERQDDSYRAFYQVAPALYPPAGRLPFSIDRAGRSYRDDLEFQHTSRPVADIRLVWGLGIRRDLIRSKALYHTQEEVARNTHRLFGHLEWRLAPDWLLNAGGNWEYDSFGGNTFAPRVNMSYQPVADQTLRLGASRAFRAPSPYETRGDMQLVPDGPIVVGGRLVRDRLFLAYPGLKPERVDGFEIGYLGEFRPYRASLDVRLFHERITDRAVVAEKPLQAPGDCEFSPANRPPTSCGWVDYSVNGQRAAIRGIEYQARWQPLEATRLLLNQTFIQIESAADTYLTSDKDSARRLVTLADSSAPGVPPP